MRLLTTVSLLFVSLAASANMTVAASDYTCSELKSLVRQNGQLTIVNRLGSYTVYPNTMGCFNEGLPSELQVMKAKDKTCKVGYSCDYYFGGM